MTYKAIFYTSHAVEEFSKEALEELSYKTQKNNKQFDITGYLCYEQKYFFQYIEGPEESIDSLYQLIQRDPRHSVVLTMYQDNIEKRRFPEWSMQFLTAEQLETFDVVLSRLVFEYVEQQQRVSEEIKKSWEAHTWKLIDRISMEQSQLS